MMNHLKLSCSLLLRYALCVLLSLLLFLSFGAVLTPLCTEIIGYDVYLQDAETGALEKAYTHFYADGEDEKLVQLKAQNAKYQVANLRSEMEGAAATAVFAAAQSLCFAMFLALVPRRLYVLGQNDFQNGNLHNPLTVAGLGAAASAAQILTFLLLVLAKTGALSDKAPRTGKDPPLKIPGREICCWAIRNAELVIRNYAARDGFRIPPMLKGQSWGRLWNDVIR